MTLSSEVPVSFHNCIIWKWLRTTLSQHFLIMDQRKTSHWFLQPIFLECAHMKHVILNQLSSWALTPLSFCQHTRLLVEIQRQLHFLNSTTNRGKKKSPEVKSLRCHSLNSLRVSQSCSPTVHTVWAGARQRSRRTGRRAGASCKAGAPAAPSARGSELLAPLQFMGRHQVCPPA